VSLEVSPVLAHDADATLAAARVLFRRGGKPNLFIKIPCTAEGLPAIEETIFAGVPVNVTLLFSREQYLAAADACLRGVERRIDAGLNPAVASAASLFVSRWDVAVSGKVPRELTKQLGIAVAQPTYKAYQQLLASARFLRAANAGARAQRPLWASTGSDSLRFNGETLAASGNFSSSFAGWVVDPAGALSETCRSPWRSCCDSYCATHR
jgi:transaldolase